ncbi:MAG TPA: sigma-54 dependent transcriptional regulator [Pyrinomonadaceae bacterium]|nr:sigma-54 dependent transcriptional regulator [Pyrinomonadaceae bacterium]
MPACILAVDDENTITIALELLLRDHGYEVSTASNAAEAEALLARRWFDLVFLDLRLPDSDGIALLEHIKRLAPETEVVIMTANGSLDVTIEAIKRGAFYYLEKPFTFEQILLLTERALQFKAIKAENQSHKTVRKSERDDFGIVGNHPGLRQVRTIIRTAAPSDCSVLIEGESGTGKEMIANALHTQSLRADRPFIRINCAAIPSTLIESELFGYRKGAFTGAHNDRRGLIEAASGGTLLLDEIAEMPVYLQTKLLRVLQERTVRRLGDERELAVDFRLISSTNRETAQMIREGTLRNDLYFRLSTVRIHVPPLRERLDDLAILSETFLLRLARKYKKRVRGISPATFVVLTRYSWPGNVRELESVIEHAVLFAQGDYLMPEDLPEHLHAKPKSNFRCVIPPYLTKEDIEREAIAQTLERTGGNIKRTAQILNYNRPTLYRKLRRFGLRTTAPAPEETPLDQPAAAAASAK